MTMNDAARRSVREAIENASNSCVPPRSFEQLTSLRALGSPRRHRRTLQFGLAIAAIVVVAIAVVLARRISAPSRNASCVDAVVLNGHFYARESHNDGQLQVDDLGTSLGAVSRAVPCDGSDRGGPANDFEATGLPAGTGLFEITSSSPDVRIAAVVDGVVLTYHAMGFDSLTSELRTFGADVTEIGINSGYDGSTRFATIENPELISQLLTEVRTAPSTGRPQAADDFDGLIIEFVYRNGLSVTAAYHPGDRVLARDLQLGQLWAAAVSDALAASPSMPTIDGITLVGTNGQTSFHPHGACRADRVDLVVQRGESLQVVLAPGVEVGLWFISGESIDSRGSNGSSVGDMFTAPKSTGRVMLEAYPSQPSQPSQSRSRCVVLLVE